MLRIVGGRWRGRSLKVPGQGVRPTADRVREALFNLLGQRLDAERVLDLFAGSGALGIEALSRGAREAVFVEQRRGNAALIRANLEALDAADLGRVVVADAHRYVDRRDAELYDTVFADPPYAELPGSVFWECILERWVAPGGRLVVEHAARDRLALAGTEPRVRRYGDTALSIVERLATSSLDDEGAQE